LLEEVPGKLMKVVFAGQVVHGWHAL